MWRISANTGSDGVASGELDSCNCFYLWSFLDCFVMRHDAFFSLSLARSISSCVSSFCSPLFSAILRFPSALEVMDQVLHDNWTGCNFSTCNYVTLTKCNGIPFDIRFSVYLYLGTGSSTPGDQGEPRINLGIYYLGEHPRCPGTVGWLPFQAGIQNPCINRFYDLLHGQFLQSFSWGLISSSFIRFDLGSPTRVMSMHVRLLLHK